MTKHQLTLDKDTKERFDTLNDLLRLILEQMYVETKMKMYSKERKRLIKEGKLDENI